MNGIFNLFGIYTFGDGTDSGYIDVCFKLKSIRKMSSEIISSKCNSIQRNRLPAAPIKNNNVDQV